MILLKLRINLKNNSLTFIFFSGVPYPSKQFQLELGQKEAQNVSSKTYRGYRF
jgi:hypothetical protein